jgi:hypothetical protein
MVETTSTESLDGLVRTFAVAIFEKIGAFKRLTLTRSHRSRLLESITVDIRKWTDCVAPLASEAALTEARRLNIDLFKSGWHDQPRFDRHRELFHLEHMVPVLAIRGACLECQSADEVVQVLKNRPRVVWILKSENAELDRRGLRISRSDPSGAYAEAGIVIVEPGIG